MATTIGVTMNFFSRNWVCHRPKRRIIFGYQMRFGSLQVEQPNQYVRVFDQFALFCKPEGKTILPNDKLRGSDQRLESIIRANSNSTADTLNRDLDDSCENYAEA